MGSWIRRYALDKIKDHWCDILDSLCGIDDISDRKKILNWGSEFFVNPIKKCHPGISDFLTSLRTLNKNWVTPKEIKDNRWLYQPLFYNTKIKFARGKNKKKQKAFSTPNDMGLPDNIKTRSIKIADFVINDKIVKNDIQGKSIIAHLTGVSKDDFITMNNFCKRLNNLFDPGEIFYNHIPKETDQEPFSFAETSELFQKAKKGSKLFRKELSKNKKVDLKIAKWVYTLDDPSITEEEVILANKALSWTDLGHDNLDRLMRLYLKKTQFANQLENWIPGTNPNCKFCLHKNIETKEDFKHVIFHCPTTKKALEHTLHKFNLDGTEALKIKELILWKFIYNENRVRQYNAETILKTITSLFLASYIKKRHTEHTEAELEIHKITNDVVMHLTDLYNNKPKSHITEIIFQDAQLLLLLESGFSPHLHPP